MARATTRLVGIFPSLGDVAFLMPLLLLFAGLDGAHSLLADGDTGWHIRAGEWMLAHGTIPHRDLFSFTRPGEVWFAWEWLSEAGMAWLYRLGGLAAVVLVAALLLATTFFLLYRLLRERAGNVLVAIGLTAVAVGGSSIHWLARPHLATLLLTVVFLGVLESGRRLWILPVLMVVWTNLHAGFVFGLLLLGAWVVGKRRHGWVLAAAAAATLVNPYGWHLHGHLLGYLSTDSWQFNHINEFLSPSFHHPRALFFELMLGLGLASIPWHARRRRWHYALVVAGAGHMALVSARNIPLFMLAAAPAVAVAAAEWLRLAARAPDGTTGSRLLGRFDRLASDMGAIDRQCRMPLASAVAGVLLGAALFAPAPAPKFRAEFDPRNFPAGALRALDAANARIFTSDQWGDYLIYRLYPGIRVFVDGRSDFYGSELERTSQEVLNVRHDWEEQLSRYRVDTVLLTAESPLAGALKESGRWRVIYDDTTAIVFRRSQGAEPVFGANAGTIGAPENQQVN